MSQQAERRVGTVIANKWRVDALLGSGSMAAVYAVTHRNGARAALKILHPTLCTDQSVCERFLGEGYLTNRVKHTGIVRVLDDGMTDDGCVFLVMDLLEGKTLEELRQARGGQLDLREALDIADKLMDALAAVHQAGIIHRDLKPQNVFICSPEGSGTRQGSRGEDSSVKLLDFGVARVFDGGGSKNQLSVFGMVLGTPSFMAPEQALGQRDKVDHRTDIWSLGATLFTAISGQTVHLGPNVQAKLLAAATVKARSVALVRQDLPGPIAAAIDMALRFKQEERWQSVEAFRRALRESRVQLGLGEPPTAFASAPRFDVDESAANLASSDERDAAMQGIMVPPAGESAVEELDLSAGAKTEKMVKAGTFIGIGGPPPLPARARNTSRRPPPVHGVAHTLGQPGNLLAQVTDESAESYPAAASIDMDAQRPRRSTFGVWLAAIALVLLAAGGVAFFAVNHANADPRQDAQATTATTTGGAAVPTNNTAPPAPAPAPAPTPSVIVIRDPMDGGAPPPAVVAPHSTTTTHAAHWSAPVPQQHLPTAPRAPATMPAQAQSQPQTPPESTSVSPPHSGTLGGFPNPPPAPDPFGTPE